MTSLIKGGKLCYASNPVEDAKAPEQRQIHYMKKNRTFENMPCSLQQWMLVFFALVALTTRAFNTIEHEL